MAFLSPFRALRPAPEVAAEVASVPYDVVNVEEARALAAGHPLSFLHVTRAEIDSAARDESVRRERVRAGHAQLRGAQARRAARAGRRAVALFLPAADGHARAGRPVRAASRSTSTTRGLIKKHEKTRKDKEDDRTRHMTEIRAQTGVVFLTYHHSPSVDAIVRRVVATPPLYDFTASDGVSHTMWRVTGDDVKALVKAFEALPALYIADGHHRAASAARAREALPGSRGAATFIAIAFPDTQVRILPYNRVVKDLGGKTPEALLAALRPLIADRAGDATPRRRGEVGMYLAGRWQRWCCRRRRRHVTRRLARRRGVAADGARTAPGRGRSADG